MPPDARPPVPAERIRTLRQELVGLLRFGEPLSSREISATLGIPEKSVADHLTHLQKSLRGDRLRLEITPAECLDCGFVFRKRDRLSRPGRCPTCRSTHLGDPRFTLRST